MMRYMAGKHENLNIKTQVIGIAIGRRDELFPTQGNISLLFQNRDTKKFKNVIYLNMNKKCDFFSKF